MPEAKVASLARLTLVSLIAVAMPAGAQTIDHARVLYDQFRYDEARQEFQALLTDNKSAAGASYYLGRIALIELHDNEAVDRLEDAVRLNNSSGLYHAWLGNAACDLTMHASKFKQPFMAGRILREWK